MGGRRGWLYMANELTVKTVDFTGDGLLAAVFLPQAKHPTANSDKPGYRNYGEHGRQVRIRIERYPGVYSRIDGTWI